uniref:hypothetical protein n=1 Tax=Candidatus Electrothrix sp. TaxID=2170559 RepID=UPI004057B150
MAFSTAAGYGNLPNGNFSPIIYSKQVQLAFRKSSTVEDITNNDYFGEIAQMGDTVKIIKEPEISVQPYSRGSQITAQDLDDEDFSLIIDKSNYFAFKIDDIEEAHSHVNFMQMATDRAAYRLRDQYDQEVLAYLSGYTQSSLHSVGDAVNTTVNGTKAIATADSDELLASMKLDATDFGLDDGGAAVAGEAVVIVPRLPGASTIPDTHVSPLQLIARMSRLLDQQFVDTNGRWLVVDPVFAETLKDEDSRLFNSDFGGSGLQNGLVINNLHGFRVYVSNNTPAVGTGPAVASATLQDNNFGVIVGGHDSAVATAQQINKTETYRDPDSFADIVRGMHLYGRKILRPEAIVTARYNTGY